MDLKKKDFETEEKLSEWFKKESPDVGFTVVNIETIPGSVYYPEIYRIWYLKPI